VIDVRNLSPRIAFGLAALVCAGLLGTGYFLEYFQGQDPCPLCYVQRFFYYGVLVDKWLYFLNYEAPDRHYFGKDREVFEKIKESFRGIGITSIHDSSCTS